MIQVDLSNPSQLKQSKPTETDLLGKLLEIFPFKPCLDSLQPNQIDDVLMKLRLTTLGFHPDIPVYPYPEPTEFSNLEIH